MTLVQWNAHQQHMDEHITWPATKDSILKACAGSDVDRSVLEEIKTKLMDGNTSYSKQDFKNIMLN